MPPAQGIAARKLLESDRGLDELDDTHRDACREWVSHRYWLIQNYLWGTDEATAFGSVEVRYVERVVAGLDGAFALMEGPERDVTVYRGTQRRPFETVHPGFVSCSLSEAIATEIAPANGDVYEILLPRGFPALYLPRVIPDMAADSLEEVLLPRGTRFILESVDQQDAGTQVLKVSAER